MNMNESLFSDTVKQNGKVRRDTYKVEIICPMRRAPAKPQHIQLLATEPRMVRLPLTEIVVIMT